MSESPKERLALRMRDMMIRQRNGGKGPKLEPLAGRAVISLVASVIRLAGQQSEAIRVLLDLYEESEVIKHLMNSRGEDLIVVVKEE